MPVHAQSSSAEAANSVARPAQGRVFAALLVSYVLATVVYLYVPGGFDALPMDAAAAVDLTWQGVAILALGIFVLYGVTGWVGRWLAVRNGLPGVLAANASWSRWLRGPLVVGLAAGVFMVAIELAAKQWFGWAGFPHPQFPASLVASYTAAVGEEIIFRLFLFSLWYALVRWIVGRWWGQTKATTTAYFAANVLAALAFAAGHLGTALALYGVTTPAELSTDVLVMLLLLNGSVGLIAGREYVRTGLVGAVGVHLGADLVWHVLYGLALG